MVFPSPYQVLRCPVNTSGVLRAGKLVQIAAITQHSGMNNRPPDKELRRSAAHKHNRRDGTGLFAECSNRKNGRKSRYGKFVRFLFFFLSTLLIMLSMESFNLILSAQQEPRCSTFKQANASCSGAESNGEQSSGAWSRYTSA